MDEIERMKTGVNEYRDKLCNKETSLLLKELGCDKYSPECWIKDNQGNISDSWTGLIAEDCHFQSYRYTLSYVQKWIFQNYEIYVHLKWVTGGWSVYVDHEVTHLLEQYIYYEDYEEGLQFGLNWTLEYIKDKDSNI